MAHGVGAGVIATVLGIAGNFLLLPLYLRHWSVVVYGEWMALYSIVNYIGALDIGLTTAATNAAAHAFAAKDWPYLKRIQGTAWALSMGFVILGAGLGLAVMTFFRVQSWLQLRTMSPRTSHLVFGGLTLAFLIAIPNRQLLSAYIAAGEFSRYQWIYNAQQVITFVITGAALLLGVSPVGLSIITAATGLALLLAAYGIISRRDSRLIPRLRDATWATLRSLARPSTQFFLQMLASMLTLQGPVIIISRAYGGGGVALFTTTRTVANAVRGILTIFRAPLRPEYAAAYAEPTKDRLRSLFRTIMAIDTTIAVTITAAIWTSGTWLIRSWSHGQITPDPLLLHLLLAFSLLEGFLWMLASAGNAANRFHGVSLGICAYALSSIALAVFLVRPFGIAAIPVSAIVPLLVFVLPVTLRNAHYEVGLPLPMLFTKVCIPFAAVAALSVLSSAGVTSMRVAPEWIATCITALCVCTGSIIITGLTMLAPEDRQRLLSRIAI